MHQATGQAVTVRGDDYTIARIRNLSDLGARWFGQSRFTLRRRSDGTYWTASGKRVAHNSRLEPCKCHHCGATGQQMQPFNQAGNLACSDVKACSARINPEGN